MMQSSGQSIEATQAKPSVELWFALQKQPLRNLVKDSGHTTLAGLLASIISRLVPGGGNPNPGNSAFGSGTWNDSGTFSDTDTWKDAA